MKVPALGRSRALRWAKWMSPSKTTPWERRFWPTVTESASIRRRRNTVSDNQRQHECWQSGVNQGIGLRKQGTVATTNDFEIVGLSPSPTTGANAAARVNMDNPGGNGTDIVSGDNFVSCTITP